MSKKDQLYHCLSCGQHIPFRGYTYEHKYCNNQCQLNLRSNQIQERNKKLFLEGKLSNRPAIRKVLSNLKGSICSECGIDRWQDKEIVLQVDHVNGDPYDNSPHNLRLLCPNCHSQTPTFTGANRGKGRWTKEGLARYYK